MSLSEFDLISQYFKNNNHLLSDSGVDVAIGDDAAVLDIPDGCQLVVTTDSLVSGIHFFEDVSPYRLGYKSLAVNLSDLAAMGAEPKWVSLAITLPSIDEDWISEFMRGFFELAKKLNVCLIGGDTTRGPLSITVSAKGIVPKGKALLRSGAKKGDLICVSGRLGDGGLGLKYKTDAIQLIQASEFIDALELTEPRNRLGQSLIDNATACIDISDGLIQDLQHITNASNCTANIEIDKLPLSVAMCNEIKNGKVTHQQASKFALMGGDDYELLFTVSPSNYEKLLSDGFCDEVTTIGKVVDNSNVKVNLTLNGKVINLQLAGWDHFK